MANQVALEPERVEDVNEVKNEDTYYNTALTVHSLRTQTKDKFSNEERLYWVRIKYVGNPNKFGYLSFPNVSMRSKLKEESAHLLSEDGNVTWEHTFKHNQILLHKSTKKSPYEVSYCIANPIIF